MLRRKQRGNKFPLTLHPTGQFCKKIRGKIHYFDNDKNRVFENHSEKATTIPTNLFYLKLFL